MTYLRFIMFAILSMCSWGDSAFACQMGSGDEVINSTREVQEEGIIITWSEKIDELRGFSQKLGDWEILKIDTQKLNPGQIVIPIASANVAAVRFGDSIAAFSGELGWWDVIDLSNGSTAVPVVSPSLVKIEDNGHLYTFSANKGSWSSPTDPNLVPVEQVISISNTVGSKGRQRLTEWMQQLPDYMERGITVKTMTDKIVITVSRRKWLPEVAQKVNELLVSTPESTTETAQGTARDVPTRDDHPQVAQLRGELATLELAVQAGSGQLSNPNVDQDQQTRELRKLVERSFDLRQQLQELEVQRLRLKLQQVESNLAVRAKSRDAMVERRIQELSNSAVTPGKTAEEDVDLSRSFTRSVVERAEQAARSFAQDHDGVFFSGSGAKAWERFQSPSTYKGRKFRPYLEAVPLDAWGNTLFYEWNGDGHSKQTDAVAPAIWSAGPNGKDDGGLEDDINNWSESPRPVNRRIQNIPSSDDVLLFAPTEPPSESKELTSIGSPRAEPGAANPEAVIVGRMQFQQPTELLENLRGFRASIKDSKDRMEFLQSDVDIWSKPFEKLVENKTLLEGQHDKRELMLNGAQYQLSEATQSAKDALKDWNYAWSAYQTQLQLLRLDVQEAQSKAAALTAKRDRLSRLHDLGNIDRTTMDEADVVATAAKINLQRAEQVLKLYEAIETSEPELNPNSVSLDAQPTMDKSEAPGIPDPANVSEGESVQ